MNSPRLKAILSSFWMTIVSLMPNRLPRPSPCCSITCLQINLAITTCIDTSLPLARHRVRGQLTGVRADNPCFTSLMPLNSSIRNESNLAAEEIALLETCTEGWIAVLQTYCLLAPRLALCLASALLRLYRGERGSVPSIWKEC